MRIRELITFFSIFFLSFLFSLSYSHSSGSLSVHSSTLTNGGREKRDAPEEQSLADEPVAPPSPDATNPGSNDVFRNIFPITMTIVTTGIIFFCIGFFFTFRGSKTSEDAGNQPKGVAPRYQYDGEETIALLDVRNPHQRINKPDEVSASSYSYKIDERPHSSDSDEVFIKRTTTDLSAHRKIGPRDSTSHNSDDSTDRSENSMDIYENVTATELERVVKSNPSDTKGDADEGKFGERSQFGNRKTALSYENPAEKIEITNAGAGDFNPYRGDFDLEWYNDETFSGKDSQSTSWNEIDDSWYEDNISPLQAPPIPPKLTSQRKCGKPESNNTPGGTYFEMLSSSVTTKTMMTERTHREYSFSNHRTEGYKDPSMYPKSSCGPGEKGDEEKGDHSPAPDEGQRIAELRTMDDSITRFQTDESIFRRFCQSPIHIDPVDAEYDGILLKYALQIDYKNAIAHTIHNAGDTLELLVKSNASNLTGGPLANKRFQLHRIEFHWCKSEESPSGYGHTLAGTDCVLEMNFIHWNSDDFKSYDQAQKYPDGLANLAIMAEIVDEDNTALDFVVNRLTEVTFQGQESKEKDFPLGSFDMNALLPGNVDEYWTYPGSLTTPPYYETVTWVIFKEHVPLSSKQLSAFRSLRSCTLMDALHENLPSHPTDYIGGNIRPVQELGDRLVRASFDHRIVSSEKDQKAEQSNMASWGYTPENGPATWGKTVPAACGSNQSPIDIVTAKAVYDEKLQSTPLKVDYSAVKPEHVENSGASAVAFFKADSPSLQGGPVSDKYTLKQFHIHWGDNPSHGSEHTVDGKSYAAELHLVHYNTDKYSDFTNAASPTDGLCVLGIFFKVGKEHAGLAQFTSKLNSIPYRGDKLDITDLDPYLLLPGDNTSYWTYPGSLTTPPCFESVTWVVFKEPIEVSEKQLDILRSLYSCKSGEGECHIVNNYRPPCQLNDRTVRSSFKI